LNRFLPAWHGRGLVETGTELADFLGLPFHEARANWSNLQIDTTKHPKYKEKIEITRLAFSFPIPSFSSSFFFLRSFASTSCTSFGK
jgi:hypothetical protein